MLSRLPLPVPRRSNQLLPWKNRTYHRATTDNTLHVEPATKDQRTFAHRAQTHAGGAIACSRLGSSSVVSDLHGKVAVAPKPQDDLHDTGAAVQPHICKR